MNAREHVRDVCRCIKNGSASVDEAVTAIMLAVDREMRRAFVAGTIHQRGWRARYRKRLVKPEAWMGPVTNQPKGDH